MKRTLAGFAAAGFAVIGLAGCGTATTAVTNPTPQYPFACAALTLGNQGQWADAQHRWLSAQQSATDGGAMAAFMMLGLDTAYLASDQMTGGSQAAHMATYQSDLSGDGAYTAGCK